MKQIIRELKRQFAGDKLSPEQLKGLIRAGYVGVLEASRCAAAGALATNVARTNAIERILDFLPVNMVQMIFGCINVYGTHRHLLHQRGWLHTLPQSLMHAEGIFVTAIAQNCRMLASG
jgi:hypothetical protein